MNVGLIGLGNMGRGLARNILASQISLCVFDQNESAMDELVELGAQRTDSIAALMKTADVVMTCLPTLASIREVYLADGGIDQNATLGTTAVDCSTSTPVITKEIGDRLEQAGVSFIDAPMLKTAKAAWDGTLHLVVGGDPNVIDRVRPVLEAVSEKIIPAGELGAGHAMKLINNAMTLGTHVIVCEALTVAQKLGVDLDLVLEVGDVSMASSNKLRELAPRLSADDHSMAFATNVALKDLMAYSEMALQAGAMVPTGEAARDLLRMTSEVGYGDENASRVATLLANVAKTSFAKN